MPSLLAPPLPEGCPWSGFMPPNIDWCEQELNAQPAILDHWKIMRHSFTHFDLDIQPIVVRLSAQSRTVQDSADRVWYEIGSPPPGGIAAPVSKLLQSLRNT